MLVDGRLRSRADPDGYRDVAWRSSYDRRHVRVWRNVQLGRAHRFASAAVSAAALAVLNLHCRRGNSDRAVARGAWARPPCGPCGAWVSCGDCRPAGALLAAALVTIDPILINQSLQVMTETLATFLARCDALGRHAHAPEQRAAARGRSLAGALLGLCVLCRPTFLVWFVRVVVRCRSGRWDRGGMRCGRSSALAVGAAAVIRALGDPQSNRLRPAGHHDDARRLHAAAGQQPASSTNICAAPPGAALGTPRPFIAGGNRSSRLIPMQTIQYADMSRSCR